MEFINLLYILPPFLAVLLVIITRKPILSLIISIISGFFVLYGFNSSLIFNLIDILKKILINMWNIKLILSLLILGGFIGIIEKQFHNKDIIFSKFFNSKKKVLFMGWLSGLLLFIDDYFNILLNGVFLNSIAKKHKISKAKIAYLIHSLGVAACVLIPFSTWTVYIISIIKNLKLENGFGIYIHSIPYNFYAITLVFITLAVILYEINILGMKDEEKNYKIEDSSNKAKLSIKELLFPAMLLIFVSLTLILINIVYLINSKITSVSEIIAKLNFNDILFYIGIISTIFVVYYFYKKGNSLKYLSKSFVFGSKQMSSAVIILILAWILGELTIRLNTASLIIESSKGLFSSGVIVLAIFILTAIIAFMTSSWAMFAIAIPILLPLGMAHGINPSLIIAAIVSGGVFGDHTSPLSSTTILTKAISKIEINKHFHTQLPYNLISFVISGYLFFLIGGVK